MVNIPSMGPVGIELINRMSGNEAVSHSTKSPDTCCSDRILQMRDEVLGNIEISANFWIESLPIEPTTIDMYMYVLHLYFFKNQIISNHNIPWTYLLWNA